MRWSQTLAICAVIMLSAAAIIGVQLHVSYRYEQHLATAATAQPSPPGEFAQFMASEEAPAVPDLDFESFSLGIGGPLELTDPAEVVASPLPDAASVGSAGEPDVLPETAATPLPSGNDLLRQIVTEELPGASSTEHDVWAEELAGLPPTVVRELLRVRQEFNAPAAR